jgi:hypothetical protein
MPLVSVFYQQCPVCGRNLRMPVQCFGRQVTCVHCGGDFRAEEQAAPHVESEPDPLAAADLARAPGA